MKIFISCVTAQFKDCRDAIASDLRANNCQVAVQEDFIQGPKTLIEKIEEYIKRCDLVISIVGDAYGNEVPDIGLPKCEWLRSYTQWEYFLALGERFNGIKVKPKDLYVYFASEVYCMSHFVSQDVKHTDLQKQFRTHILNSGKAYSSKFFKDVADLQASVLRDLTSIISSRVLPEIVVERIINVQKQKEDLWNAITLYCSRLPEQTRYDPGEFQELIKHHIEGSFGPHRSSDCWMAYCFVAKIEDEVVGMLLAYEDKNAEYFFILYLVAKKPHLGKFNQPDISRKLLEQLLQTIGGLKQSGKRLRILGEVDYTPYNLNEKEQAKNLARIKLFEKAAVNLGIELRFIDIKYIQPQLDPTKPEVEMKLIYMTEEPPIYLKKSEVIELLTWTYTRLYSPDIFEDPFESQEYESYLNKLLQRVLTQIPESVKLMRARQLK